MSVVRSDSPVLPAAGAMDGVSLDLVIALAFALIGLSVSGLAAFYAPDSAAAWAALSP